MQYHKDLQPFNPQHVPFLINCSLVNGFIVVRTGFEPALVVHLTESISSEYIRTLLYHHASTIPPPDYLKNNYCLLSGIYIVCIYTLVCPYQTASLGNELLT